MIQIDAPLDRLQRLRDLREEKRRRDLAVDPFITLGFQPNCADRTKAAEKLGFKTPAEAIEAGHELPPHCGNCPQERFLAHFDDPNTDQLYGGAAGGSKSTSLLLGSIRACHRYPGLQAFWFRRTFPELEQSVLRMLTRYGNARAVGARYDRSRHELRFANDSILTFAHAKNVDEATALQSAEINLLILDERTTIPPDVVDHLYTRVRSGVPTAPTLGIRSATNPGGIGHSRVKTEYVEATDHGAAEIIDGSNRVRRFIQARVTDTPQLGPEYADSFAGYGEQLRKAFLDGDWDVFAGQVFTEWRHDRHVVPRFTIPPEWRRLAGIDYGYAAPWAVLWGAVDNDARVWIYREEYDTQVGETDQAKRVLADEAAEGAQHDGDPVHFLRYADPSMWRATGEGLPIADVYTREGAVLQPANNERIAGWQRVHTYLADGPPCAHHRALGWTSCPKLHVLDGTAPNLVRTLPAVPYDKHKVEDVDTLSEDHAPDALRYLLMGLDGGSVLFPAEELAADKALDGSELLVNEGRFAIAAEHTHTPSSVPRDDGYVLI